MSQRPEFLIDHIYLAIHPGYSHPKSPVAPLHPRQVDLSVKREQFVRAVAQTKAVLLHFPYDLSSEKVTQEGKVISTPSSLDARQIEELRISSIFRQALGDRYFFLPAQSSFVLPSKEQFNDMLSSRNMTYYPERTTVVPFGELQDVCVVEDGGSFRDQLGIPKENFEYPTSDLSLSNKEFESIWNWRMNLMYGYTDSANLLGIPDSSLALPI